MMRLLAALLLACGCAPELTVVLRPTAPTIKVSKEPLELPSKRVLVQATGPLAGAASAAVESALLRAGWSPLLPHHDARWLFAEDSDEPQSRFVIRAVREGVDRAHPIDGCRAGPHLYAYWVEVDAELVDEDDLVIWTGRAQVRSSDLLGRSVRIEVYADGEERCDHISPENPVWRDPELREVTCADRAECAAPGHDRALLQLAVERLVGALTAQSRLVVVPLPTRG